MKLFAPAFILLLTAGCATSRTGPDGAWLAGTWLMMSSRDDRDLTACASGLPISYDKDGTYSLFEESGRWSVKGSTLTETATEAQEDVIDPAEVAIGQTFRATVRRFGRGAFIKTYSDGRQELFRRCPKP